MNGKILAVLLAALVASSLFLVNTSYESRRLFAELDRARAEQRKLDADYKRLDAEAQAQATHLRVEKVAREKLRMRTASPAVTERVEDPGMSSPMDPQLDPQLGSLPPPPQVAAAAGVRP